MSLSEKDANEQVDRLTALLRQVVRSTQRPSDMKWANYDLATVPKDWWERVDAATTYVPVETQT